jgi:hypothetical protein
VLLILAMLLGRPAAAGPQETRDALDRLDELLEARLDEGRLSREDLAPALVVRVEPRYADSEGWFAAATLEVLEAALGPGTLRLCEACMAPRTRVRPGVLDYRAGPTDLDEVVRLDAELRGDAAPASTAIFVEEHARGVAIRIVELSTGNLLWARNVDPDLDEDRRSERVYTRAEELERRARGGTLTHGFFDAALFPQQHLALEWADQWGPRNQFLSGVTLSVLDPAVGLGVNGYVVTPLADTLVGGKLLASLPTALVRALGDAGGGDLDIIDPLVTGIFVVKVPLGRSNYGALMTLSTNGRIAFGISLMNTSLGPLLP